MVETVPESLEKTPTHIIECLPEQKMLWDDFVEEHPESTMYHLFGWKNIFEKTFGYKSYYLMACDSRNKVTGILPLFVMRDILGKKFLVSNPFSNFCGLVTSQPDIEKQLLEKAIEIAHTNNVQYVELRQLGRKINLADATINLAVKESFVTLMLSLGRGRDAIWKGISSRNRGKVRKAEKAGLQTAMGLQYLDNFYSVWVKNLRFLGTPVYPYKFFQNLIDEFPDNVDIMTLKHDNNVVAGMFIFKFKDILSEPWVSALREYNKIYINNLLYWKAIKYACDEEYSNFDFGRSTIDTGTYNFKRQWGAVPVQLYYQYYLNKATRIPVVDAKDNKYDFLINIWKKLPLGVTNFVGPKVVKYLPEL